MTSYNTGWVGEWHPMIVDRGGTGGAWAPRTTTRDVKGPIRSRRASGIAELEAHGLEGCRIGWHTAP